MKSWDFMNLKEGAVGLALSNSSQLNFRLISLVQTPQPFSQLH